MASYWRKGDRDRWGSDDLTRLVEALAQDLPAFQLPGGAVHAHTRHYMPKRKAKDKTLVFDAFLHLPRGAEVVAMWPDISLPDHVLALARDLADGIGYLGRAESWTECRVVSEGASDPNCVPAEPGAVGDLVRVLVPRSATAYSAERQRLLRQEEQRVLEGSAKVPTEQQLRSKVARAFRARRGADTLPEQLLDALSLDTADLQWGQPPAAYEAIYARSPAAAPRVIPRVRKRNRRGPTMHLPTRNPTHPHAFWLPEDFAGASRLLASSRCWRSVTPFLAPGHLKKAGYEGEVRRLLRRRGFGAETVAVDEIPDIDVGGTPRRALNFHRFRTRGREQRHDSSGTLLKIEFPGEVPGPLALGYGSHFGLGMFRSG